MPQARFEGTPGTRFYFADDSRPRVLPGAVIYTSPSARPTPGIWPFCQCTRLFLPIDAGQFLPTQIPGTCAETFNVFAHSTSTVNNALDATIARACAGYYTGPLDRVKSRLCAFYAMRARDSPPSRGPCSGKPAKSAHRCQGIFATTKDDHARATPGGRPTARVVFRRPLAHAGLHLPPPYYTSEATSDAPRFIFSPGRDVPDVLDG